LALSPQVLRFQKIILSAHDFEKLCFTSMTLKNYTSALIKITLKPINFFWVLQRTTRTISNSWERGRRKLEGKREKPKWISFLVGKNY